MIPLQVDNPYLQKAYEDFAIQQKRANQLLEKSHLPYLGLQRECVYQRHSLRLYRYGDKTGTPQKTILIVYAFVNSPRLLDVSRNHSFIGALLKKGYCVYLLDWGNPGYEELSYGLTDFIFTYLDPACDAVLSDSDIQSTNLLGVCQGGTLSLCYASLRQEKINKLITLVTPVDFHKPSLLRSILKSIPESVFSAYSSHIPSHLVRLLFQQLKPCANYFLKHHVLLDDALTEATLEHYLSVEAWLDEARDLPGKASKEFWQKFYQDNALICDTLTLNNISVSLKNITLPVLNLYARRDHIVPPNSSANLKASLCNAHYEEAIVDGGHVSCFVSPAKTKAAVETIDSFL